MVFVMMLVMTAKLDIPNETLQSYIYLNTPTCSFVIENNGERAPVAIC